MDSSNSSRSLSRRELLKKTLYFSTASLTAPILSSSLQGKPSSAKGLDFLAFGDFGSKNEKQFRVAAGMNRYASKLNRPLQAVLALGDNFYGKMVPERFDLHFEDLYSKKDLNSPFYVCLGNHDYEYVTYGLEPEPLKTEVQLAYAKKHPLSRWKLPHKWYSQEFEFEGEPLVRLLSLDSNMQEGALTPQEKLAQKRFVEAELAKGTTAPWTILMWHHPLYTETTRRADSGTLQRMFGEFIKQSKAQLVINGHDHNLQHLKIEGFDTNFVISGGGGAREYEVREDGRGFALMNLGFNHIEVNQERMKVSYLDADGKLLYRFSQYANGRMESEKVSG